ATNSLPDVLVDTTGIGKLSILQFEELNISPDISLEGINESDVSYQWRLYPVPGDTVSEVISEEPNLSGYQIELTPTTGDKRYRVTLTVTDEQNDLEYITAWPLQVLNSLGEGLVVAEATGNGDTDLSLIMSPQVTAGFTKTDIKRHIYSAVNGQTVAGIVKGIQFTQFFRDEVLLAITDNSIVRINTLDYSYTGKNSDLFFYDSPAYHSQHVGVINKSGSYRFYLGNQQLSSMGPGDKQFTAPLDSKINVPTEIAVNKQSSASTIINFYDEENGQFAYLGTFFAFGSNELTHTPSASGQTFDPANVPGKENIAANAATNGNTRHLLKDKKTGEYHLYVLNGEDPPAPLAKYDFADAPEIDNAKHFVLPDNQRVMYY